MVTGGGLEPPRVASYAPQTYASAGSAIPSNGCIIGVEGVACALKYRRPRHP